LAENEMAALERSTRRSGHKASVRKMSRYGLDRVLALSQLDEIYPNETGFVSHVCVWAV